MAAYLIANIEVRDPSLYDEYRKRVPVTIAAHGAQELLLGEFSNADDAELTW